MEPQVPKNFFVEHQYTIVAVVIFFLLITLGVIRYEIKQAEEIERINKQNNIQQLVDSQYYDATKKKEDSEFSKSILNNVYGVLVDLPSNMSIGIENLGESYPPRYFRITSNDNKFGMGVNIRKNSQIYPDEVCPGGLDFDRGMFEMTLYDTQVLSDGQKVKICKSSPKDKTNMYDQYYSSFVKIQNGFVFEIRSNIKEGDELSLNSYRQIISNFKFTNTVSTSGKGILSGYITIGPNCPVERVDKPCITPPEAYTSRFVEVYKENGKTLVTKQNFDTKGYFSMELPSGTYIAKTKTGLGSTYKAYTVIIESGGDTGVNFDIDTGIR